MKHLAALLFLLSAHYCFGQPMFKKTYGFGAVNEGKCAIQTFDHGYAIAGSTTPSWGGQTNAYLVKTDSAGNAMFHYSYGTMGIDKATSILQLPDSGFLMAGYSNGLGINNDYDAMLIRTDKNGNQQWIKSFGTSDWDFIYDLQFTPDGNCILAGSSYGSGNGSSSGYVVKVDYSGNVIWEKFISGSMDVSLAQILAKADGSLTACGKLEDLQTGATDGYIMFMDSNGDTLHSTAYDKNNKNESFNAIGSFSNGDIAVAGLTEDTGNVDELFVKIDTGGNEIWFSTASYSGNEPLYDLFVKNDTLIVAGSTTTFSSGNNDFRIILFSDAGWYISGNTYGGSENEFCYNVIVANDGGYVFLGTSTTYGPGQQSVFFVKSDTLFTIDHNVSINVNEIENALLLASPNPTTGTITVSSGNNSNSNCNLRLYDLTGRIVLEKSATLPARLDIEQPGIYFLRVEGESFSKTCRVIVGSR